MQFYFSRILINLFSLIKYLDFKCKIQNGELKRLLHEIIFLIKLADCNENGNIFNEIYCLSYFALSVKLPIFSNVKRKQGGNAY